MGFSEWAELVLIVLLAGALLALGREFWLYFRQSPVRERRSMASSAPREVEQREYTAEELALHDGEHGRDRTLLAINGTVFDVTRGGMYAVGGSYHVFAGHDASLCLAKGSLDKADLDKPAEGLEPDEQSTLEEWEQFFRNKYDVVGTLKAGSRL